MTLQSGLQRVWNMLSFSDISPVMKNIGKRSADIQDLTSVDYINRMIEKKDNYPSFLQAHHFLRSSPLRAILKFEKKSFFYMFFIHITDVSISLLSTLLAVQILHSFEPQADSFSLLYFFFPQPTTPEKYLFSIILAFVIFILNVSAASLHGQKLEREMFLSWRVPTRIMQYMYELLLNISPKDRSSFKAGDISNMAQTDARYMGDFFSHVLVDFPVLLFSTACIVFIMIKFVGNMAWIALLALLLQIPISLFFSRIAHRWQHELMKRTDRRLNTITEWIQGMRLVRYFGWSAYFKKEIHKSASTEFWQDAKLTVLYCLTFALTLNWWMFISICVFIGLLFFGQDKQPSVIFAITWFSSILGRQIVPLPWFLNLWSQSRVASERLKKFFDSHTQEETFKKNINFNTVDMGIIDAVLKDADPQKTTDFSFILDDISVQIKENEPYLLKNIHLKIEPRKTTAIVGPIAAGKSLLLQVLLGDIVPTHGEVILVIRRGEDETKIPLHSALGMEVLRKVTSYVPQEAFIVSATIKENVPLQYQHPQLEERTNDILNALYAASLGPDLKTFPGHINTEIGERGVNLSGGQKQRISLSRSAFFTSSILILDDPLSAVDKATEEELVQNIFHENWGRHKTIIWSTHRLDHIHYAHHIVFLDQGKVVEEGSYKDLMERPHSRLKELIHEEYKS